MNQKIKNYFSQQVVVVFVLATLMLFQYIRHGFVNTSSIYFGFSSIIFLSVSVIFFQNNQIKHPFLTTATSLLSVHLLFSKVSLPQNIGSFVFASIPVLYGTFLFTSLLFYLLIPISKLGNWFTYISVIAVTYFVLGPRFPEMVSWMNLGNREFVLLPYLPPLSLLLLLLMVYITITHLFTIFVPLYTKISWEFSSLIFTAHIFLLICFGIYETPATLPMTFESCQQVTKNTITKSFPRYCITVDGRRIKE